MRPIFTGEFIAFSDFDREAIRSLVRMVAARRVLEIGSWLGNGSTQELASMCHEVYCVDHWLGNANVLRHQNLIREFDAFATFEHDTERFGSSVRPMIMSSEQAAMIIANETFDLVFIDADHSYSSTLADIEYWRSKVRRGGVLCGHDCEGRPNEFDRVMLEKEREADTIESDKLQRIHPGCILAVDVAFGGRAKLFAETELQLPDGRRGLSTIWYVRM
jgi:predicted O-methyltransferase YrrM